MSRGVNKVIIVGNMGQDPEVSALPSGGSVTNISVATSESWKDKQTGQPVERTEWHRVVFFNKLADIAAQYLRKGSKVYIEGQLRTRKWQDKNTGSDRYSTEIVANQMQMLDSRDDGGEPRPQRQAPQQQQATALQQGSQGAEYARGPQAGGFNDFDDDIPFR